MADIVVGNVGTIVSAALKIKEAVDTVQQNKKECCAIAKCVDRVSALLKWLEEGMKIPMNTAMRNVLKDLEESLQEALGLVTECQQRHIINRFFGAGNMAKELHRVQEDIVQKIINASLAINIQMSVIIMTHLQLCATPPTPPSPESHLVSMSMATEGFSYNIGVVFMIGFIESILSKLKAATNNLVRMVSKAAHIQRADDAPPPPPPPEQVVTDEGFTVFSLSELKAATNDFSDENIVARGGSVVIYKGVLCNGLVVAIKKFNVDTNFHAPSMFRDEFEIGVKLQHKNVVNVLGYYEHVKPMSTLYEDEYVQAEETYNILVLGYVPNGSLHEIIKGTRCIDWSSCFRMIEGIAEGVYYLHEQHVIHMDLKPMNILFDSDMNPVIIDFGISKVLDHDDEEIFEQDVLGSLGYMAPEYIANGEVSTKCDVYAFGITLRQAISSVCCGRKEWVQMVQEAGEVKGLLDPALQVDESQVMEIQRCWEVALLCTQMDPADRPTMADVVQMLKGEKEMPTPKKAGRTD